MYLYDDFKEIQVLKMSSLCFLSGKPHKLVDDLFVQVKPGLSAYEKDPKKVFQAMVKMYNFPKPF